MQFIVFTGLPGAGKSRIAEAAALRYLRLGSIDSNQPNAI
jgi:adenylylsulfate kinase-like enzyme